MEKILADTYLSVEQGSPTQLINGWCNQQILDELKDHIGKDAYHGCPTRDFSKAYRTTKAGDVAPKMYRASSEALARMQYIKMVAPSYAAVIVLDVDSSGGEGGFIQSLPV